MPDTRNAKEALPPRRLTYPQLWQEYRMHRTQHESIAEYERRLARLPDTAFTCLPYQARWRYHEARIIEERQAAGESPYNPADNHPDAL